MFQNIKLGALIAGAVALSAPVAKAENFINILTGGTSGVYYPLGVALSEVYGETMPDARVQVQSTKASVENLNLLQQGRGELAFALGDSVKDAWEGNPEAGFKAPLGKLRAIAAIYPNFIQVAALKDAGATTITDLKGKSLSVGAAKSGTELNARKIFDAAGMSYDDLGKVEYLPFSESVELMKNRQLDATFQSSGLGNAALKDLSTTQDVTFVAIPADIAEKLGAPYKAGVIPAGTYPGQDADVPTVAITNILVTREGVSDEEAYQMTKQLFEHLDTLKAAHSAANGISAEAAVQGLPIPLHPGAERYYKEIGILK
ncbi:MULTISPECIES: TAXI family TRAP transporter solute-binding subunit [Thioclava]|uniref:TAXI family TRAP transporter solute-binding subunit n=1 Tax=Thioclava electrotropha TaxID=1549850 RepID=A0ABX6YRI5_9RHOB|nr:MULTISPECIES: TAXI family TRAP transporter solute-binding subunit [Thioclava]MAQ35905.1 C4-dicarboxylate ABC transporter [Thioclava sp.]OOY04281.1 C4-dicarboxylate ABC transporter [Thioclava sp. F28-4]OOY07947.1 C4-dicarboxylate ABC transporter [Thioclava sp. F36-7]OOY22079.1 C4-dicarboxylate ABC transporter [Thioclava sp. DLFJ5-1]QPZ89954.1 TAXI family TRAP transporter solute-binding subunit [Thioclava electrotropha]